jgi:hypothetical protein
MQPEKENNDAHPRQEDRQAQLTNKRAPPGKRNEKQSVKSLNK